MHPLQTAPLNALRAAEATARLGSLRAAAQELGVSPGAVSQQIARAESALGRPLFDRRPGGLRPAEGTEEIFLHLREGFSRLTAAVELTRRDRAHILTISVAPIFAARWLIWRLPEFTRAHPEIKVRLDSSIQLVDPNAGDVDFAIRIGPGGYQGLTVERLLEQRVIPVCSADWAAKLQTPADLAHVPIIRDARAMFDWDVWLGPEGLSRQILGEGPEFNEASLGLDSAMAGEGVLLAFETLCHDALERGQVAAPFPRYHPTGLSYWLVSARDRSLSLPQRRFRSWLKDSLASSGMGS
ncbi:transcriptional regulator, LysR family [Pseudooceanicola antarcticus]|uniref:LysR family transcriptional regulator n=1 Tax=Pseudooceanicola antarcticus TaxID=1247613 RepID=A0A285HL82_9RHOB|nr:LysR substrate-binding domain-containing protein [Pseudooceanicola antarcticus]PJE27852.1 LysR family transcriptional regulator [Pseudooceanicola antarcticus]SNY36482.1 transcriptional regulator, LysR family [Pseudooceanicola antarcticus]